MNPGYKQKTTFLTKRKKSGSIGNVYTQVPSSTSLRWCQPDQVQRVLKSHFNLSLFEGTPSGKIIQLEYDYIITLHSEMSMRNYYFIKAYVPFDELCVGITQRLQLYHKQ
jgi:hypothetical protein